MVAGSLTYDTKMDTKGFQKGINDITNSTKRSGNTIKNIVAGLGITKLISTALSTINSSIDGAVKRVDTLNNFPKVMENLGISSEKSEKSIKKISEGLKGLPTTLNDGALAVQRFTSTNGDVEKSTEYFLALNNAILAGGAGTELQASALEQLSQAYSKGKPDMMEWRTLMMAMPAQLKQVASALGYINTDELYEALKNGKLSMDDFMQAITKLNKDGTGEFLSFEQQAKNAVGGIGTSVTNARTAVTRGVAKIIDEIDKALKKNGFGGISKIINDIGKTAENVLENIGKFAANFVKILKDVFNWFNQNQVVAKALISTVTGLVAAFVTYKTALIAIKTINFISTITGTVSAFISLIPAIKSAKDAITLLSMVTKANPFAVLVAGIAAVVAAVAVFVSSSKKVDEQLQQTIKNAEDQRKSWEDLKEARKNALEASESEIGVTQKLADELKQITDENGKVKEGYENRAKYILGELNKALGTEYSLNGNIIENYKELKENVDKLIQSKRVEATLDAYKEQYGEAIKKQSEATKTLVELRQKLAEVEKTSPKNTYEETAKQQAIKGLNEAIKNQTDLIGEYGYTIEKYENLTAASVSGSVEEIDGALKDMTTSYDEAKEKVNYSLNAQIKNHGDYVKGLRQEWQKAKDNNDKYQEQILKKQLDTQEQELKNLGNSLAEQTSTVDKLSVDQVIAWKKLAEGSEEAYREALSKVPPETAKQIQEATGIVVTDTGLKKVSGQEGEQAAKAYDTRFNLGKPTKEELSKAKEYVKNNNSIRDNALKLADKSKKAFDGNFALAAAALQNMKGAAISILKDRDVPNAGGTLGDNFKSRFNAIVDPFAFGQDVPGGMASGMTSWQALEKVQQAANQIAEKIRQSIHFSEPDVGPLSDFHTYMPDMIDLMVKGINDNKYKVSRAMFGLTSDMQNRMKNAVNLEVGNMNATATVRSNSMYNSVIQLNAKFDGSVEMDGQTTGRILTPYVTKTIKAGGAY